MNSMRNFFIYLILSVCGLSMIVPFIWMVTTALKSESEVNKGHVGFIPVEDYDTWQEGDVIHKVKLVKKDGEFAWVHIVKNDGSFGRTYLQVKSADLGHVNRIRLRWENFRIAFNKVPFGRYFLNTLFVSFTNLIGVLVTGSLAAYAFARMHFFGKNFFFYLFISMMMVPQPIYLIPSFVLLTKLGWIDTYAALIVPWLANIFTIFLLRQQFKTIPQDLFDAASIDGCSRFGMLWHVALPLSKPVLVTASIFSIIGSWNSFMWPLVMTDSPSMRVLQVGLSYFSQESSSQTSLLMAASTFSIMPLIILFFIAQKQIMASVASSGLKG